MFERKNTYIESKNPKKTPESKPSLFFLVWEKICFTSASFSEEKQFGDIFSKNQLFSQQSGIDFWILKKAFLEPKTLRIYKMDLTSMLQKPNILELKNFQESLQVGSKNFKGKFSWSRNIYFSSLFQKSDFCNTYFLKNIVNELFWVFIITIDCWNN